MNRIDRTSRTDRSRHTGARTMFAREYRLTYYPIICFAEIAGARQIRASSWSERSILELRRKISELPTRSRSIPARFTPSFSTEGRNTLLGNVPAHFQRAERSIRSAVRHRSASWKFSRSESTKRIGREGAAAIFRRNLPAASIRILISSSFFTPVFSRCDFTQTRFHQRANVSHPCQSSTIYLDERGRRILGSGFFRLNELMSFLDCNGYPWQRADVQCSAMRLPAWLTADEEAEPMITDDGIINHPAHNAAWQSSQG